MTSSHDHLVVECEQRRRLVPVAPAARCSLKTVLRLRISERRIERTLW